MANTTGFRARALTPDQETAIAAALAARADIRAVADAYGVSVRTIYRARDRAKRPAYEVDVAGYRATFQLEDGLPIQVTPWVPA